MNKSWSKYTKILTKIISLKEQTIRDEPESIYCLEISSPLTSSKKMLTSLVHVQEGERHCYEQIFGVGTYAEVLTSILSGCAAANGLFTFAIKFQTSKPSLYRHVHWITWQN